MHNYGEAFLDRYLTEKVRYAKEQEGSGVIRATGRLDHREGRARDNRGRARRHQHQRGCGRGLRAHPRRAQLRQGHRQHERLVRIRGELGKRRPKLILSFVSENNSADEQAFIEHWRTVADKSTYRRAPQLGTLNHESNYPCLPALVDLTVL